MEQRSNTGHPKLIIAAACAIAVAVIVAALWWSSTWNRTQAAPPPPTQTAPQFDAAAGAGGNTAWLEHQLRSLAAKDGDGTTRDQVNTSVRPATDAGWGLQLTGDWTTLEEVRTDAIQVALQDAEGVCLVGAVGVNDQISVHVAQPLQSTESCLLLKSQETP